MASCTSQRNKMLTTCLHLIRIHFHDIIGLCNIIRFWRKQKITDRLSGKSLSFDLHFKRVMGASVKVFNHHFMLTLGQHRLFTLKLMRVDPINNNDLLTIDHQSRTIVASQTKRVFSCFGNNQLARKDNSEIVLTITNFNSKSRGCPFELWLQLRKIG